jgi:hypothetical protein
MTWCTWWDTTTGEIKSLPRGEGAPRPHGVAAAGRLFARPHRQHIALADRRVIPTRPRSEPAASRPLARLMRRSPSETSGHGRAGKAACRGLTIPGTLSVAPAPDGRLECTACAHRGVAVDATARTGRLRAVRFRARRGAPRCAIHRLDVGGVRAWTGRWNATPSSNLRPGSPSASRSGMLGCDLRCPWCSNAQLSQALRGTRRSGRRRRR